MLFQLYKHGVTAGDVPKWVGILSAAEDWGTPPWDILPGYATKWWWLQARNCMMGQRNKAAKQDNK